MIGFFAQSLPKGTAVVVRQHNRYGKDMKQPAIVCIFDERQHSIHHESRAKALVDDLNHTIKKHIS